MQRFAIGSVVLLSVGVAALVGCAVGTDPSASDESDLTTLPVEAGDAAHVGLPPITPPGSDAGTGDTGTGTPPPDSGTPPPPPPPPPAGSCASPNTCGVATDLGSISGDTGFATKTATGSGSQWFKIRLTEDDGSLGGWPMSVTAELTSPAGTNFDVYVYMPGGSTGQECSAVTASSTSSGSFDTASKEWGETGAFSNGSDDARTVTVEVRWVSGTCSASSTWNLTVRGDT